MSKITQETGFLANGYAVAHLANDEKPMKLVHPECHESFRATDKARGLQWVNSYHHDAPYEMVSRFALCAHCQTAIRR